MVYIHREYFLPSCWSCLNCRFHLFVCRLWIMFCDCLPLLVDLGMHVNKSVVYLLMFHALCVGVFEHSLEFSVGVRWWWSCAVCLDGGLLAKTVAGFKWFLLVGVYSHRFSHSFGSLYRLSALTNSVINDIKRGRERGKKMNKSQSQIDVNKQQWPFRREQWESNTRMDGAGRHKTTINNNVPNDKTTMDQM